MTLALVRTPAENPDDTADPDPLSFDKALVLKHVTEHAWQVCDSRQPPRSSNYLLGFVETRGNQFELMQIGNKFIWTTFPTMRDALTHVAQTARATAAERVGGDLAWLG